MPGLTIQYDWNICNQNIDYQRVYLVNIVW
jgi:hypothetical protein